MGKVKQDMKKGGKKKAGSATLQDCFSSPAVAIPAVIILIIVILSILAPVITHYDETGQSLMDRLSPPGNGHLFGTDELGRDVFTRVLFGTRVSLMIAVFPTALAVIVGTVAGVLSAWFGKVTDFLIMRFADVMLSIPGMLLAMVVLYTMGGSVASVFISLVLIEWGGIARVVRTAALEIQESEFVTAALSTGAGRLRIIIRHILPNLIPTLIVLYTLNIPSSILSESALSFLGIGIQPPEVSLGLMAGTSRQFLFQMPWLAIAPAGMIMVLVLAFNFLGDALRDILDPRRKKV